MAAPGLMSWELWEACSGPRSCQRRLSPTSATGREDSLEGALRAQALSVTWLHLIPEQLSARACEETLEC